MPRKKSGLFDQSKYIQQYIHDNVKHIKVSLNKNKPEDMQIIAWIAQQPEGASGYIKRLIREDISGNQAKDYGATYDYMRSDFTDGKADVCERICQALMKNGVLVISRIEHHDRVRFKWLLRGEKQKEPE